MAEERDWTRMQFERCPDCGYDASTVADEELGAQIVREVAAWGRFLAAADPSAVRVRPAADVWSALEYACHVRDLLPVMSKRLVLIRTETRPELGWWDHEAAAVDDRYNEQVPVLVIESMTATARAMATALGEVSDLEWERGAERRPSEEFTIRGIGRFALHEVVHHHDDASRSMRRLAS